MPDFLRLTISAEEAVRQAEALFTGWPWWGWVALAVGIAVAIWVADAMEQVWRNR